MFGPHASSATSEVQLDTTRAVALEVDALAPMSRCSWMPEVSFPEESSPYLSSSFLGQQEPFPHCVGDTARRER